MIEFFELRFVENLRICRHYPGSTVKATQFSITLKSGLENYYIRVMVVPLVKDKEMEYSHYFASKRIRPKRIMVEPALIAY